MQPAKMPEASFLEKKKIEMMFQDKDEDHILLWYAGTVLSATASEEGILAKVQWDGDFDDLDEKVTEEELTEEGWAGYNSLLKEWSWRLA